VAGGIAFGDDRVRTVLSTVLAYWIVPATLFFFWLRYLPRQDFRGTLLHVFLMTLSWRRRRVCHLLYRECFGRVISGCRRPKNIIRMILALCVPHW